MSGNDSIKLFTFLRRIHQLMGIGPPQQNAINLRNLFMFLSATIGFVSIAAYFLFKAHSVEEYVNTFHVLVTSLVFLLYFSEIVWQMPNITALIQQFVEFIVESKWTESRNLCFLTRKKYKICLLNLLIQGTQEKPASKAKYSKSSDRIEFMSKMVYVAALISFLGLMVPALCVTIANYFWCDLEDKKMFHLPSPMLWVLKNTESSILNKFQFPQLASRLPFDWETPLGYTVAFLIQSAAIFSILVGAVAAVCHLIGSCWMIVAFVEDISSELSTLNADEEESCPNEREWKERVNNIIRLHSHVKGLSGKFEFEHLCHKKIVKFSVIILDSVEL